MEATGVLRGKRRRVFDSMILADAVATQDTVTQLIAAGEAGKAIPTASTIWAPPDGCPSAPITRRPHSP
jgi:hypothetical protein